MSLTTQQIGEQLREFLFKQSPRESNGPVVLIWEMGGFPALLRKNAILAAALRLRGCRPHMIICDGTPLGCIRRGVEENDPLENWQHRCSTCSLKCAQMAETYGVPFSRVGDYLPQDVRDHFRQLTDAIRLEDVLGFSHRGVAVGQLAWSSLNRYLKGYSFTIVDLPAEYAAIYRQYFYAAMANTEAAARAMQQLDPASLLTSHGVYADYAPALALAHLQGRAAMSWASGYADCLHYFTVPQDSNRVVVRGLSERAWLKRAVEPLTADEEALLDNFLHERYFKKGARDIEILSVPEDASLLRKTLGISNNRPIVCLFAHVNWDACFDFSTMIFPTANDWVIGSIRKMIALPEVNWIIRVHPGEITDGSVYSTGDIIKQHFPQLPDHIKILWADSEVNSFGLYRLIDAGITIFGTVGAELTAMGKPVIVAGESHYSGKGFTRDAHSHSEYLQMLEQCSLMTPLTGEQTKLARQYAFSFFIQRQIPIRLTQGHMGDLDPGKMSLLLPGQDAVIDLICAHILDGEDIILEGPSQPTLEVHGKTDMPQHSPLHQLAAAVLQHLNLQTPTQKDEIVRKIVANAEPGLLATNLKAPQNRMRDFASVDDLVGTIAGYVQSDLEGASLRRVLAFIEEAELLNTSRKSVLDIGCGKGLFAFVTRKILGHEVVATSHLKADPFFYEFIRTRVYGIETPLHWAIDKSGSLPPQIASRSFDCIALHSFSGHGHDKPDALKWQASDWLRFLYQLHTLLNPQGRLQLRHIAFGEGILEELKKSLESEPCFKILNCDVDNGGDKVWYQAIGPQTVWGLTLQKIGPRFAIKVPQSVGSISRVPSPNRDRETTTQLQLEAFGRFEAKDWTGALHLFDKALVLQPAQGIHLMRARCLLSLQQPTQAREALEAELRMNPNHPDALQLRRQLSDAKESSHLGPSSSVQPHALRFSITVPVVEFGASAIGSVQKREGTTVAAFPNCGASPNAPHSLLGFDPEGEVFLFRERLLRGVFPGHGQRVRRVLESVRKQAGFDSGLVSTTEVRLPELEHLGYDLVLEHERLPFVTYAHEWTSEMLQQAALFQLDLNLRLSRHDLWLKDCGVPANVLFRNSHPVFVDFLSLVFREEVETQEFLQPRRQASPLAPLWTRRSACFHEIFLRMFHPYLLYPLYMLHQGHHAETRKRLLATTLNSGPDVIHATEAFAGADKTLRQNHERALAARELALVQDRWEDYLQMLRQEVAGLKVSLDRSNYSNYYDLKKENFSFDPSTEWLPKQRAVHEAISRFRPTSVLDIGSNTGWFSILAAHHGAQVVAVEIDEASANLLYRRAKMENLAILPLVMDFTQLPPAIPGFAGHEQDPHVVQSKIPSRSALLLPADQRLQCDMVLALAIVHHFTLGRGFSLEETVRLLASFSRQQLVLEFVAKEDPLIVNEPDFFPAFKQNPGRFDEYTRENWLKELRRYFSHTEVRPSTGGREIFVCSGRTSLGLKRSVLETQIVGSIRQ